MANNPLEPSNKGNAMPGMTPGLEDVGIDPSEFVYRVGHFTINGEDDDTLQLEALLSRTLTGEAIVVERTGSISTVTGTYTCVVIYMEKRLNA
jgi:hypothetical protein